MPPQLPGGDVTDNCAALGELIVTTDPADLSTLSVGDHAVTVTVADPAGNKTTCVIMVSIEVGDCDTEPPPPDVSRDLLRFLLSIFFRTPVCGMGAAMAMPLTIIGLLGGKLYVRRRRHR